MNKGEGTGLKMAGSLFMRACEIHVRKGGKSQSVLYRVIANQCPTAEEPLVCQSQTDCGGFQLEFVGEDVENPWEPGVSYMVLLEGKENPWEPAASYMALLEGKDNPGTATVSLENAIDYGLWPCSPRLMSAISRISSSTPCPIAAAG